MRRPTHVGFIMDGNRRFSRRLLASPTRGHEWGRDKLKEVLEWCKEEGIEEATVYAFSMQNFDRPKAEFDYLMSLFEATLAEILSKADEESPPEAQEVRVRFIGRTRLLPEKLQELMRALEQRTAGNTKYRLNVAVAYGGREEIVDAVKALAQQVETGKLQPADIDETTIDKEMYLTSSPDLIIRTGGDHRTSNFLIWQSPYSEWFFVESLWPEFSREEFKECLESYASRERRFGK